MIDVAGRKIGPQEPCFIVAEIGQNHQGDVYQAVRLLKAAHDAGCDAVKLCKRDIPSDLTRAARDAPYSGPQSFGATYGQHREALELSAAEYRHLKDRMRYNEWPEVLFASACDRKSVDVLEEAINPPLYKVASRDLDNLPLLDYLARLNKPLFVSAGMARQGDIFAALNTIYRHHNKVVLLVCTSEYPTPAEHVGLNRIREYREQHGCLVGWSDHTTGIVAAQAAATLGAVVVEKHLTLSRAMRGTDHAASLEPDGMARLVRNIRLIEEMRHSPLLDFDTRHKLGRSIVSARDIQPGEVIEESALCLKSPGSGLPWYDRGKLIGKSARRFIPADSTLQLSDVLEVAHVPA